MMKISTKLHGRRALAAVLVATSLADADAADDPDPGRPIVIAHRGASGMRPEHTLASYALAIEQGADYIEPDLVITKDGVLVARHEPEITGTTDVADHPEFADRKTTKRLGRHAVSGWFVEDFTLIELKTLRARERLPELRPHSAAFDGRFQIPTLEEIIMLAHERETDRGRPVGLYIETKHPSYFRSIGLPLEEPLLESLHNAGLDGADDPVFIQSFESENLRDLADRTEVRLIRLIGWGDLDSISPEALAEIANYADGIGPDKALVISPGTAEAPGTPTGLVDAAHDLGLLVHPWTFRSENAFLPPAFRRGAPSEHGDAAEEYRLIFELGVDGVFSDWPGTAVEACDAFVRRGIRTPENLGDRP